jgi:hypothetical protein
MKRILFIIGFTLSTMSAMAQAPQGFKYQAVIRDGSNVILVASPVGVQLTIRQGIETGPAVYTETFATNTNAYGLVNLEIGSGVTTDDFSAIDWADGPYYIETSADLTGGTSYESMELHNY